MIGLLRFVFAVLVWPFTSQARLHAEIAVLRQQVIVLQRKSNGRVRLSNADRWFFVQLYRMFPSILQALHIIRPETLVRWHRAGFRSYWRWKSRNRGGRPQIDIELRALIRQISNNNPLWGAPRIHGELLKLGFEVAQSTVAKYMIRRRGPPGQSWWTFLRNHAPEVAAMDLFVVPTLAFSLLYGFVIVRLDRRALVWTAVTRSPTAEWIAADHGSVPLGFGTALSGPRLGPHLWLDRKASPACDGHSRQTHCTSLTLAERFCRTIDWVHSPRVLGPHDRLRRGSPVPVADLLRKLITTKSERIARFRKTRRPTVTSSGLGS